LVGSIVLLKNVLNFLFVNVVFIFVNAKSVSEKAGAKDPANTGGARAQGN
jgi:hypothetical protein